MSTGLSDEPKNGRGSLLIVETKSGLTSLRETSFGTQMSNSWVRENLACAAVGWEQLFDASDRLLERVPVNQSGVQNVGVSLFEITPVGDEAVAVAESATRVL